MRVAALVSGGKDSALALYRVLRKGYRVEYLATMIPHREDSWMFHFPNIHMTDLFSRAVGIPLKKAETVGIKEEEIRDLKDLLSTLEIDGVVSGTISSTYQKKRIDKVCQELNIESIMPLWKENPLKLLREIIDLDFDVIIVGVYAHGFDKSWIGKKIDPISLKCLVELNRKYHISLVGEGGEYETLVLDAPFFKKRIQVLKKERIWEGQSGYLLVNKAKIVDKD